jgi:signal transduction histidine kinase
MGWASSRLRWQLTLSHLAAIAVTLVSLVAAVLAIGTVWRLIQGNPEHAPARQAESVARAVAGLVRPDGASAELDPVLRALARGQLRMAAPFGPDSDRRPNWVDPALQDVAYIVVVGPDGRVLGSSDPSGPAFAPPEREEWLKLAQAAVSGTRDSNELVTLRKGSNPAALGAAPLLNERRQPLGAVVLAQARLPSTEPIASVLGTLVFFGAASAAILVVSSLFALGSSSIVAYLLSRRLVTRLERLGRAADSLAAGEVKTRVEEGPVDELGQFARQFNRMAEDLERTLSDLQAERDRVTGLLDARRQLVASVSHELRTPVAAARGYLDSILGRAEALPAELRTDLETVERELARLQQLIEDLFALARVEVGRLELRPEPIEAGTVVRRLVDAAAPLAWRQRQVQVFAEIDSAVPPVLADGQRLEQVVSNLLTNAIRHTPPGGLVAAAVALDGERVRIEVRDTGDGIPSVDLPHVFERFYRGQDSEGRGGAGLGLALAKELVDAMDGSIQVASTLGEGSCFTVHLPRA